MGIILESLPGEEDLTLFICVGVDQLHLLQVNIM